MVDPRDEIFNAVLYTLRYYTLFRYPLKAEEIYGNLPIKSSLSCILVALEDLEKEEIIFNSDGYYSIDKQTKNWVLKRKEANGLARKKTKQALWVGRFIYKFPFVRFVGISGSLSKGYADAKSDFDFFIVTAENRLWICRTILHLFKKMTFLAGQQNKFCMNYFIDINSLEIEEQNQFTAIELSSLIPVSGHDISIKLKSDNEWVNNFLPNGYVGFSNEKREINDNKNRTKNVFEFFLNYLFPTKLNELLMRLTDKKWRKKWEKKNYPMEDYNVAFKTTLTVSKNHPSNHQKRILNIISQHWQHTN